MNPIPDNVMSLFLEFRTQERLYILATRDLIDLQKKVQQGLTVDELDIQECENKLAEAWDKALDAGSKLADLGYEVAILSSL